MDLNFNNKLDVYYQKFVDLQEKLKTSEEQRFMLEMKFNDMVHVAKEEEQAHYRKLRAQYKTFLEEDQKRQERNERIIRNLERVEAKISILSAKTERISMFRRQYHKYLKRIAGSCPKEKISDSKISRERSFIKEEPSHEPQKTLFRDDYSLPDRPKELYDNENLLYKHPAVKKSLEKDRSNEEKIEILDKYLQSISSQKCRDVLNQERQAREKLTLDMPLNKNFHDELTSNSTNHATAVADDIMNSIYSRYYTKADVAPTTQNKVDLAKDTQNGNNERSDYVKKDFKPNDKAYLDSVFTGKPSNGMVEKGKLTVTFKKEETVPQLKDKPKLVKDSAVLEQTPSYDFPKSGVSHLQDQREYENVPITTERKQDSLKMSPAYISNESNYYTDINNDTEYTMANDLNTDPQHSTITGVDTKDAKNINKHESVVSDVLENETTLPSKIEFKNIGLLNENPPMNMHFENNATEVPYDAGVAIENYVPQIVSNKEQNTPQEQHVLAENQPRNIDKLEEQYSEQIFHYEPSNPVEEDTHQSREYPLQHNSIDQNKPSEETYYAEEPYHLSTRQVNAIRNEHDIQDINEDYSPIHPEIAPSIQNDQLIYNNQDQSSIQYNENYKTEPATQYNPNTQPPLCDQDKIYNNQEQSSIQYNENYETEPSTQYNPNNQPQVCDQDKIYNNQDQSSIQYNENYETEPATQYNPNTQPPLCDQDKIYNNQDQSSIQYNENYETKPSTQYNPNNQPPLCNQDEIAQSDQYNPTDPSVLLYGENPPHEPTQCNEPEQQTKYLENDPSNQQNNEQPIQYDENGQPVGLDQYGQPLMYDQNGQIVQPQYDENGQLITQYDEHGQMVLLYDHNGQQLFDNQYKDNTQYDLNGQPMMQYDENGQPIYEQNQQQYYDYPDQYQGNDQGQYIETQGKLTDHNEDTSNQLQTEEQKYYQVDDQGSHPVTGGNEIQEGDQQQYYNYPDQYQADDQGQYIETQGELNDHNEVTSNPLQTEEQKYYQVDDQGPHSVIGEIEIQEGDQYKASAEYTEGQDDNNTEAKHDIIEENKKVVEVNDDAVKPTNVMDILDTDTESVQQNTSKISNGSDFDFS